MTREEAIFTTELTMLEIASQIVKEDPDSEEYKRNKTLLGVFDIALHDMITVRDWSEKESAVENKMNDIINLLRAQIDTAHEHGFTHIDLTVKEAERVVEALIQAEESEDDGK